MSADEATTRPAASSLGGIVRDTWRACVAHDVPTYSAALAFHAVLALFPFLLFLVALLSIFHLGSLVTNALDAAQQMLPAAGAERVRETIDHLRENEQPGLLSFGMLGALWAAAGGVRSAILALNRAYRVKTPRATWRRFLVSTGFTAVLALMAIAATALLTGGPNLIGRIVGVVGLRDQWVWAWHWLRYPAAVALLMMMNTIFYSLLPNVRGVRWVTWGSVLSVSLWLLASGLFRVYASRLADYSALYGSIGAVIVMLLYAWLSSAALLIGAELNGVLAWGPATDP